MDRNIYELIRGRGVHLAEGLVRLYMWQLLQALDHMHRAGIFHRCAAWGTGVGREPPAPRGLAPLAKWLHACMRRIRT